MIPPGKRKCSKGKETFLGCVLFAETFKHTWCIHKSFLRISSPYFLTVYAGLVEAPEKSPKRPSEVNVNPLYASPACKKPLIHMYEKEFTSEICCGSLWGKFGFLKLSCIF